MNSQSFVPFIRQHLEPSHLPALTLQVKSVNGKCSGRTREHNKPAYLLDVCDVTEFNDFVPLRRPGSGAGALETQMTEETEEIQ